MAYSVQKSAVAKVVSVSLVMLLAACSSNSRYKREVSGNEDYLKATPLAALNAPAGMILPVENGQYGVPAGNVNGAIGKQLDIRPPSQPLALVNGARTQFTGDTAVMIMENANGSLWSQVASVMQDKKYPVLKREDASQSLTTDWIQWNRADEDAQYRARYQVSVQQQQYQQAIVVKLLNLEQSGKPVADAASMQRYSAEMLNAIATSIDKNMSNSAGNTRVGTVIDVQSGADDAGLPVLIVRTSFNDAWTRLPNVLNKIGMKVTDSTRSQGSLAVTYSSLSDSEWRALGAVDPGLEDGKYKLQVGDLDNRSSLQFIDPKGHTLTQSQNDALVAVFQAAFK